jgi:hypothetical protein
MQKEVAEMKEMNKRTKKMSRKKPGGHYVRGFRFPLTMRHNNCSKVLVKDSAAVGGGGGEIVEAYNALKYENTDYRELFVFHGPASKKLN